ncbi:hypothetical protein CC77DRAFT_1051186 [Alternaria alternata]|jgi:hypothetical protein|uniref:Uncharacterized protein n=2 Tax=Alternaria alternata complex TaxID=187734 RepID=A0A177DJD2_ALTAL|nr:hypothetical protein CC77DRAFT_1051186 [Alternaria alternata]RII24492.1 hypothetical protein CUC08_Gglean011497 [Alternaria sp. MG1]RYN55166.1 hypothetical protein AA0114_g3664 [Alternaria tenuissima]KAH6846209.1 hypothetical protein B0T12DRAFT_504832 [Alternaria alternata]OAG19467.1 hypothetical protein CC77DRAFT_1051186 [Alternaria alternata]OWY49278.1 hypothetical protein AALT_g10059 [Alternaria alternata]
MSKDQSHLTDNTQNLAMQETEEAAMLHMWRTMGYGETPGLPNYKRHPIPAVAEHIEPIAPAITLTTPTPPSSHEVLDTSQKTRSLNIASAAFEEDACPPAALDQSSQEVYRSSPPPTNPLQHSGSPPTKSSGSSLRFVPRQTQDYEAILQAMATGKFDIPIFGAAGAAFMNRPLPGTPIAKNRKRKCAETPHDTDGHEVESASKEPARKKKTVKLKSST